MKTLYDIVYLLFSLEVNRNPSALLTNAIFFELVLKGEFSLDDMPKKMPMAMKGAVAVSRKYRDSSTSKKKLANDYGEAEKKEDEFNTFKDREKELFDLYTTGADDKTILFSKLINDWYGIEIKNPPILKGYVDSDKTLLPDISPSFYEYTLESLSELLELILKNEGLSHVPVLPSKYVFIEDQDDYGSQTQDLQLRKLLSNVEAKLSNHQNGDIVLSPINMNNEHAVGLIFARQHKHSNPSDGSRESTSPYTNNITAYYIDPANKPIPAGLQKVLHGNGYRVEQLPAQQQISTNCGSELVANFKLYLTGDRFKQKEEIIAQNKLYENSLKQGQPSNVEYGSGTLNKVVDTIDPLRLTKADALSLSTLVENLISALETESVDLANSSPILLSPKQEARELWKKQQEKYVLKNVLNILQQAILFPVSVESPKLVSEKEEAQNAYYGASMGTVGMGGVLRAISKILANTPKLVLFAGATGLAASVCGGNYLENLQQELVGEFAKSDFGKIIGGLLDWS